jgi:hypothetical protein
VFFKADHFAEALEQAASYEQYEIALCLMLMDANPIF